jgi:hypothetical protein
VWVYALRTGSKKWFFSLSVGRKRARIRLESSSFLEMIQFK